MKVVRFHGRNRDNWEKKGISVAERFRYLYSHDELAEWLPKLAELASKTKELHVMYVIARHKVPKQSHEQESSYGIASLHSQRLWGEKCSRHG